MNILPWILIILLVAYPVQMVREGWGLDISPQAVKLYRHFPCYRAHTIYYSEGQSQDENGDWVINNWKMPDYDYAELFCADKEEK